MAKSERIPKQVRPQYDAIVALIEQVCREHLNEEYAEMGRKLAAKLARKRPSPLLRGKPEIWACGIMHALGTVNFLFDNTNTPYMSAEALSEAFGVKRSTCGNKAATIRKMFKMYQLDPKWTLPSRMDSNPYVWLIQVNGLIVDARALPREIQVIAYEKGLIPYIPADREET